MRMKKSLSLLGLFLVYAVAWGQDASAPVSLTGHNARVTATAFSPDSLQLASADWSSPTVFVWSVAEKKVLSKLVGPTAQKASITTLAYSPDGKLLAASSYDFVAVWNLVTGKTVIEYLPGKGKSAYGVAFSPKEPSIAVALTDSIAVFNLRDGKLIKTHAIDDVGAMSFSSNAKSLFLWRGESEHAGLMIEFRSGRLFKEFKGGHTTPAPARFSRFLDGDRQIVTAGFDGRVVFWDPWNATILRSYEIDGSPIASLGYSQAAHLLVAGTDNGTLWQFDVAAKKPRNTIKGDPISCLTVSGDGRMIAVGYGDGKSANDRVNQGILHLLNTKKERTK
jgi:WD40 repeat protein